MLKIHKEDFISTCQVSTYLIGKKSLSNFEHWKHWLASIHIFTFLQLKLFVKLLRPDLGLVVAMTNHINLTTCECDIYVIHLVNVNWKWDHMSCNIWCIGYRYHCGTGLGADWYQLNLSKQLFLFWTLFAVSSKET